MTITQKQNERLNDILTALKGELERNNPCITGRAVRFVNDQIARHDTYGDSILLSPAQWKWLEDLYTQVTGEERPQDDRGNLEPVDDRMNRTTQREGTRDKRRAEDPNDEIPF